MNLSPRNGVMRRDVRRGVWYRSRTCVPFFRSFPLYLQSILLRSWATHEARLTCPRESARLSDQSPVHIIIIGLSPTRPFIRVSILLIVWCACLPGDKFWLSGRTHNEEEKDTCLLFLFFQEIPDERLKGPSAHTRYSVIAGFICSTTSTLKMIS